MIFILISMQYVVCIEVHYFAYLLISFVNHMRVDDICYSQECRCTDLMICAFLIGTKIGIQYFSNTQLGANDSLEEYTYLCPITATILWIKCWSSDVRQSFWTGSIVAIFMAASRPIFISTTDVISVFERKIAAFGGDFSIIDVTRALVGGSSDSLTILDLRF